MYARKGRIEVLIETFLRKQLRLKAHTVTKVEETEEFMVVHIDRLGSRLLRCGLCRQRCRKVHSRQRPRVWRDLAMRKLPLKLRYRPRRVECPRCGVRVEDFPWAEPWARVTMALSNAVARLARELSWQGTARQYGLNWKSVATIVRRAVQYGLKHRQRPPVHVIGIDEVSRRKGQVYGPQAQTHWSPYPRISPASRCVSGQWSMIWSGGFCCGWVTTGPRRLSDRSSPKKWAHGAAIPCASSAWTCGRLTPIW